MKKLMIFTIIVLFSISAFLTSCTDKLNSGQALTILKYQFPFDTAWQTSTIRLQSLGADYLKSSRLIKQKKQVIESTPGGDGLGVPSQYIWDNYELSDKANSLLINSNINSSSIVAKTHFIVDYTIKSVYFATEGSNQAEVEFEVNYALSPFSGEETQCPSSSGGAGGIMSDSYVASFYKSIKCNFKKFEDGWIVDDKQQIGMEIKSLNKVKDDPSRCGKSVIIKYKML